MQFVMCVIQIQETDSSWSDLFLNHLCTSAAWMHTWALSAVWSCQVFPHSPLWSWWGSWAGRHGAADPCVRWARSPAGSWWQCTIAETHKHNTLQQNTHSHTYSRHHNIELTCPTHMNLNTDSIMTVTLKFKWPRVCFTITSLKPARCLVFYTFHLCVQLVRRDVECLLQKRTVLHFMSPNQKSMQVTRLWWCQKWSRVQNK